MQVSKARLHDLLNHSGAHNAHNSKGTFCAHKPAADLEAELPDVRSQAELGNEEPRRGFALFSAGGWIYD